MAVRVELNMHHGTAVDHETMLQAGWHCIEINPTSNRYVWPEVHRWCVEKFGGHNYTHWGARFYFRRPDDALLFALKYC